ncbi:hypothetical protein [Xanthocytophaga agilis]|uniref:Uncharacterized protein n=1 Tax=Xanthocytophaga agilis TaxID=3048010 RepID=A0AAE3RB84_9BACT|nr:hypothetical protein [Xanthocytophaga agilis]MDJ1504970.1 hypothetical protein [Xanthocytophaga agilis]
MKQLVVKVLVLVFVVSSVYAQKVEYKDGIIKIDGKDLAKVNRIKDKENMGLTSTYEVFSIGGEKLAIATVATEYEDNANDNSTYYYRITFLTTGQLGIFALSKLGAEKSFAKLIGNSGIIVNDQLDSKMVTEFIAKKGRSPKVAVDYTLVSRDRFSPISFKEDKTIEQGFKIIGAFKDVTTRSDLDTYEISLPTGVVVAKVSFTGGNNAKNCQITTLKDNNQQLVDIGIKDTVNVLLGVDRNVEALKRIVNWLVTHEYL